MTQLNLSRNNQSIYFFIGLLLLTIPYIFWLYLGENSYILIHDNLDNELIYVKQLLESNNLFGFSPNEKIQGLMNGNYRFFYRSGFNYIFILFALFSTVTAYILNHFFVHIVGYIGMYLLLSKYFIKQQKALSAIVAFLFGCISYYHIFLGLSVAGQPLLLFAFLNILYEKKSIISWFIILLFPFTSFIVFSVPFFLPILCLIALIYYFNTKKIPLSFAVAVLLFCAISLLIEFNLLYSILGTHIESHRVERKIQLTQNFNFFQHLKDNITYTQYHMGKLKTSSILIAFIVSLLFKSNKYNKISIMIILLLFFIALWQTTYPLIVIHWGEWLPILKTFQFNRFYLLMPTMWLILLAISLHRIQLKPPFKWLVVCIFTFWSINNILNYNQEWIANKAILLSQKTNPKHPTYKQFVDKKLFTNIKHFIEKEENEKITNFTILCIGIKPNILQYNGFHTLGSYQNNYALNYKHQFREIIEKELNKNEKLKKYFDNWGNRCYAFSSELDFNFMLQKNTGKTIENLEYNFEKAKKMNAKYVFSAVPINNNPNLNYLKTFTHSNSLWEIYIYEIK